MISLEERIPDDLINIFCERLQNAMGEKPDGMLAMQFVTCDPVAVRAHINGERHAYQIIHDEARGHYILLEWKGSGHRRYVRVYDPLMPKRNLHSRDMEEMITKCVRQQIVALFGHLFDSHYITVALFCGLQRQHDDWSCGLRAIGHLTLLATSNGQRRISQIDFKLRNLLKFFTQIINEERPSLDKFRNAKLGRKRPTSRRAFFVKTFLHKKTLNLKSAR